MKENKKAEINGVIFQCLLLVHSVNSQCCSYDTVSIVLGLVVMNVVTFILVFLSLILYLFYFKYFLMKESLVNHGCLFHVAYYISASPMYYSSKSVIKDLSLCRLAVTTSSHVSNCSSPNDVLICFVPSSNIWKGFPMKKKIRGISSLSC